MQDYCGRSEDCTNVIRDIPLLALIRHRDVRTVCLEKILRNSYRICQFLKANMGIKHAVEIQAIRNLPEDGIYCSILRSIKPQPMMTFLSSKLQTPMILKILALTKSSTILITLSLQWKPILTRI